MDTPEVCEGEEKIPLPGFRFHPTDEELVSFYLRRKVEKRGIRLELIKQMDIYKHNPWDLPYGSSNLGEKEWYFYCKRGRKYKNSIRPNRVTGSGFWKATGIDKPVYSNDSIIGLKKTLVYYRGSAGKGSKTDWMMHEFRLPPPINISSNNNNNNNPLPQPNSKNFAQEAEIWTLCRIFKRNVSGRRYGTNWNNKLQSSTTSTTGGSSTVVNNNNHDHDDHEHEHEKMSSSGEISYINFRCHNNEEMKPLLPNNNNNENYCYWNNSYQLYSSSCSSSSMAPSPVSTTNTTTHQIQCQHTNSNQLPADVSDFFTNSNWDELRSVVDMF